MKAINIMYKNDIEKLVIEKGLLYSDVEVVKTDYQLDITKDGKYLQRECD